MAQERVGPTRGVRIPLRPASETARGRRSLDQRIYARFPVLYRFLADVVSRLSPGSRVRRLILARSVALAYAAANRRDFDVVLIGIDSEVEYRPSADLMPPDLETAFHG